jgi:hypothetical protein
MPRNFIRTELFLVTLVTSDNGEWKPEPIQMLTFVLWVILFIFSWPLALIALILYPFVWLLLLPFRILGIAVHGVLELVKEVLFLPVRLIRAI